MQPQMHFIEVNEPDDRQINLMHLECAVDMHHRLDTNQVNSIYEHISRKHQQRTTLKKYNLKLYTLLTEAI